MLGENPRETQKQLAATATISREAIGKHLRAMQLRKLYYIFCTGYVKLLISANNEQTVLAGSWKSREMGPRLD